MTMPPPQFTLRALLVAMLVVAAFFGGIRFERERRKRADKAETQAATSKARWALTAPAGLPRKPNYGPPIVGSNATQPSDKTMPTLKQWHHD